MVTRAQAQAHFDHVLNEVLGRDDTSILKRALVQQGIGTVLSIMDLDDDDIPLLEFVDGGGVIMTILRGDVGLLRAFRRYIGHRMAHGPALEEDWTTMTAMDFNDFRLANAVLLQAPIPSAPNIGQGNVAAPVIQSPVEKFRRGIKRDASLFPILKDEKLNDSWHRSFTTQARAQDVDQVCDPEYVPVTPDDIALFAEKQKYLYAVLESTVRTDRGKAFIREHEDDFDAQSVYRKLLEHHRTSTKAQLNASDILTYITSARLGNGTWPGTTEGFILHWQDQVRLHDRLVPRGDQITDNLKKSLLENAVAPIESLNQVKINAAIHQTHTGQALDYNDYCGLVMSAAANHDAQSQAKRGKRQVLAHEFGYNNGYDGAYQDDVTEPYGIDSTVDTIHAFAATRGGRPSTRNRTPSNRAAMLPTDLYNTLSEADRTVWRQLSEDGRIGIVAQLRTPVGSTSSDQKGSIRTNAHETSVPTAPCDTIDEGSGNTDETNDDTTTTTLIHAATTGAKLPPTDLRRLMSKSSTRTANFAQVTYQVTAHTTSTPSSLVDRGANGGLAGEDVRVITVTHRSVDIRGISNHQVTDIAVGTVGGVVQTQRGPVIAIFHQYACLGKGASIHSSVQLEHYRNDVNDKSIHAGGLQRIHTVDGYVLPLNITDGLPRLDLRPYTDAEWNQLPHVIMTAESDWDPTALDHSLTGDDQWFDAVSVLEGNPNANLFDEYGNYVHREPMDDANDLDMNQLIYECMMANGNTTSTVYYDAHQTELGPAATDPETTGDSNPVLVVDPPRVTTKEPDYQRLRRFFGWMPIEVIKQTFKHTTQYAHLPVGTLLKRRYKSPNPALNVHRRNESIACDIVYSDTPAVDSGATAAVIFVGLDSQVTDIHGIKTDKQFVNTLEDNIRRRGAPTKLISDGAKVEISKRVLDILRTLCIQDWQSEPYQQHQNHAERRFQTVQTATNRVLDRTGAPSNTWLLCMMYVCFLLNHTYNSNIGNVPLTALTGDTVDTSVLLQFSFWQKVYYRTFETKFPSESPESVGHIVGISEHCGNALTWKILTADTHKIIFRSLVRPYTADDPNLRAELACGEPDDIDQEPHQLTEGIPVVVRSSRNNGESSQVTSVVNQAPVFDPGDLVGRTFLLNQQEDGQRHRARIVRMVEDHESKVEDNPTRIKFLLSLDSDGQREEIITYNELLDHLDRDEESNVMWKFKRITSHQGPLRPDHPDYKGSKYNVMVEWETGEITSEPLQLVAADDPVTCAIYAKERGLLDTDGWKRFKAIAKRQHKFERTINQAKLRSYNTAPRYKYGYEVPKNYEHALRLDERNGNTKWRDAVATERAQIHEYDVFEDCGHHTKCGPPAGYKKIRIHLVFDVKHDGRHKARLVADGHLTDIPLDSVYSGVVSLRGFRLVVFLAELNGLQLWATDIGNAYLEAKTCERVYIIAGPEFEELEGHILVIFKALYGLRSSGARWHERLADCLRGLGFIPCKAEPDIWMRKAGAKYEYVAVYVDDLALALEDPQCFVTALEQEHKFKLKGTGPILFHLGMDFTRDEDQTLCISPTKYIDKMVANYEKMFGAPPRKTVASPLEGGDHPELDTTELLDAKGIEMYQSLIGALQWIVSIGRLDVHTAVMTMSGFRVAPKKGHLERAKRIYGYLSKMKHAKIRVRTGEPDYSDIPSVTHDWAKSVYGEVQELKPHDAPEPLGKFVTLTQFVDANLMHDVSTGRSVTGILTMINKTPLDWYSKKQATVETATYGSEFVAARTCVEQLVELRTTLRYLGVPLREKSYMFGDNKSVVDSGSNIDAKLHKRHTMLSFHRVREAIASGIVDFIHIPGKINPADILSKHWSYSDIWGRLKPLLFWQGDTADIGEDDTSSEWGVTSL